MLKRATVILNKLKVIRNAKCRTIIIVAISNISTYNMSVKAVLSEINKYFISKHYWMNLIPSILIVVNPIFLYYFVVNLDSFNVVAL